MWSRIKPYEIRYKACAQFTALIDNLRNTLISNEQLTKAFLALRSEEAEQYGDETAEPIPSGFPIHTYQD